MSIENKVSEITIRARIPIRKCDGCGKPDLEAGGIQVFARDGDADVFEATRAPAVGWNNLWLNGQTLDVCTACSAQLVINARAKATAPAAPVPAPTAAAPAASNGNAPAPASEVAASAPEVQTPPALRVVNSESAPEAAPPK